MSTKGKTEETIIQNILNGKKEYETELYNNYKKIVEDYLNSKYPNLPDIEDVISEIMARVFINLKDFDHTKSKFKTWVINLAKNYVVDVWRKSNTSISTCDYSQMYSVDNTIGDILDYDYDHDCTINITTNKRFDDASTLSYIANQISEEDYELLDLKYNQGFNYNEIGLMFNLSSCTVNHRVNYIKTKLKRDNPEIEF